eukprot:GHVL01038829.1.p2 GENE.GHVL01038829.1~~GHVL01038829.1.p2  ORF type:complete len:399 (-),score=61.34 GHVL01038829.1:2578-3774(-)
MLETSGNDDTVLSNELRNIAHELATPAKAISGCGNIKKFIEDHSNLSFIDYLKIWKILHNCMLLADKRVHQEKLSNIFADLMDVVSLPAQWVGAFYTIMQEQLGNIDRWRQNKFLFLIRVVTQKCFAYMKETNWDSKTVQSFWESFSMYGPLTGSRYQIGNGGSSVALHWLDIIWDILLEEMECLRDSSNLTENELEAVSSLLKRIVKVASHCLHEGITNRSNGKVFQQIEHPQVIKMILPTLVKHASDRKTMDVLRPPLYDSIAVLEGRCPVKLDLDKILADAEGETSDETKDISNVDVNMSNDEKDEVNKKTRVTFNKKITKIGILSKKKSWQNGVSPGKGILKCCDTSPFKEGQVKKNTTVNCRFKSKWTKWLINARIAMMESMLCRIEKKKSLL